MLKLFAKYTSIGVINTLIHWVVFAICIYAFHTGQALGNFAGFVVAVSFSFCKRQVHVQVFHHNHALHALRRVHGLT